MSVTVRAIVLICLAWCTFSVPNASAASDSLALDRLFGVGPTETFTIRSEVLDRDFYIYVRLPQDYDDPDCDWPVVYMLDGGILFPMLAPYHFMMEIDGLAPAAVLVGISYGGLGFEKGNYRATDYTAPAEAPGHYGGAGAYQHFLADELIPKIAADYRVDHDRSLILGQSLGGQFTLYTALTRPDLFSAYLSINPALHRNVDHFVELEPVSGEVPTRILITRASEDPGLFQAALDRWLARWRASGSDMLALSIEALEDEHHASSAPAAYRAAMQWWTGGLLQGCTEETR